MDWCHREDNPLPQPMIKQFPDVLASLCLMALSVKFDDKKMTLAQETCM